VEAYVKAWQLEDAIALLEGVVAEGSQLPEVYHKLGDLYRQAGLDPQKSASNYQTAIQLSHQNQDLTAQASAQVALANLLVEYNQVDTASEWLRAAQANYEAAGQEQKAEEVALEIANLSTRETAEPASITVRGSSESNPLEGVQSPGFIDFPAQDDNPIQDSAEPRMHIDFP
jgi:tetratricopeptide (TPR) repeat protein